MKSRPTFTRLVPVAIVGALVACTFAAAPASALTTVAGADTATWNVNDSRRPAIDTGSIRNVSGSRMEAFGSLFVHVDADAAPRMNDQMLRGFGLKATTPGEYASTQSVRLGDVLVTRKLSIDPVTNVATFFDTFTNTTTDEVTVDTSFGGSLGYGIGANASTVTGSSDGNTTIDAGDAWVVSTSAGNNIRATGIVTGSAAPYAGATTRVGNQQLNPFEVDYSTTGSARNDPGFVHSLSIEPGSTESLLRYIVVGARNDTTTISATTSNLLTTPDISALSIDELCTVANWDPATLLGTASCAGTEPLVLPPAPVEAPGSTDVAYDVTGKTITQLQADLRAGVVTSVEITQAYLDRIAAYDQAQLGFKSFISVADNALEQAAAADAARKAGADTDVLGVPIALKDLYDTKDQITTGGTRALKDWQPATDAWQVAALRKAGAVLIGKTNLSEFANSGSFSESGFEQTWNALYPSKTSFGSSGGSATATAVDFAAAAMGTQTGVSLYAPTTGAGLSAFRGTDGLTSTEGVMPLTWATDYAGPIAKDVSDLAAILNVTATQETGNDPADIITNRVDNSKRPVEWTTALDKNALQGKKIGYVAASFNSALIADSNVGTTAFQDAKAAIEAAGGTMVELTGAPSTANAGTAPTGGNAGAEGWERYIAAHAGEGFPFTGAKGLLESKDNLPYNVSTNYTSVGYDDANTELLLARRDIYKERVATWMDTNGAEPVDAVIYAGFISNVGNNDASTATLSSDRATGVLTQTYGVPTVILPIGKNDSGQSNSIQLVGRAWDDAKVLGMGYAIEQSAKAKQFTEYAPALPFSGPAPSTTTVELDTTSVVFGGTATATVTVASDPTAKGDVSVTVDGKTATGTLVDGVATVELPGAISVGTHLVTASFAGSEKVAASEAATQLAVTAASATLEITPSTTATAFGSPVVLDLALDSETGALPAATKVFVYDGANVIATTTVDASGEATVTLPELDVREHTLKAEAVENASLGGSISNTVNVTVAKATATATMKLSSTKAIRNSTRIKATVTVAAPGVPAPTGTFAVTVSGKTVYTYTLTARNNGTVTVTLPAFSKAGSPSVKLVYKGSATLKADSSPVVTVKVSNR